MKMSVLWWDKYESKQIIHKKAREQLINEDNKDIDSDYERKLWRQKMLQSRRSDTNMRVKLREEYEDRVDRLKELEEENRKMTKNSAYIIILIESKSKLDLK